KALRADPTATEKTERGWTIIERGWEIWSFTPADHPAHTSAAKRTMYQDTNGGWRVVTRVLGQSTKASCDALMQEYEQFDEQMKERIRRERGPGILIPPPLAVTLGLVPRVHRAAALNVLGESRCLPLPWIAGTSPAMTVFSW